MPKLYIYLGIAIFFYSNEHEPIHIHGGCANNSRLCKAEIITSNGKVSSIKFKNLAGNKGLSPDELANFQEFVNAKAAEIVEKWAEAFLWHKNLKCQVITQKVK